MQGLILAAGMGKRLGELTDDNTKCMVKVNGVSLIERALRQLDELGLERVIIVVGYKGRKLMDYIGTLGIGTPIEFIDNPIYDTTNNIYSLALAKDKLLEDDTLLLESDLIFEEGTLRDLVEDPRQTLALVAKHESWMDGTCVTIDDDDNITGFINKSHYDFHDTDDYYKTVNIYKFSKAFSTSHYVPFLEAYQQALGDNEYYEQVLRVIALLDDPIIQAKRLGGRRWYEIDDPADLDVAESLFEPTPADELVALQGRYGGYWRYPALLDFCYLVNPFYPPQKLIDEMETNFTTLLTQYPSGMRVNSLLAAKVFGVRAEHIVVGNGAAELIKSLTATFSGRTGVVRPTFEEYPNRLQAADEAVFRPAAPDFSYTAADLEAHFADEGISQLVLINPDNPTGNYLSHAQVLDLVTWCEERGITLVIDESFADFSDETDNTFLDNAFLTEHPSVVVVKSISKSFGVPGLRLGVLASGDTERIAGMKRDVAIWNINSFAEFYLQIAEKYVKDYRAALVRFRAERDRLIHLLAPIPRLRPIPSQANYLMVEVERMDSCVLAERLLDEHRILIKDLAPKLQDGEGAYVRIAVKTPAEDDTLVAALREIMA